MRRIANEMKSLGYEGARVDDAGNAVGHFGEGSPVILTDCHVDTIPDHGKGLWHHEPFAADRDEQHEHAEDERARAEDDPDVLITTFENLPTRTTPVGHRHPRTAPSRTLRQPPPPRAR